MPIRAPTALRVLLLALPLMPPLAGCESLFAASAAKKFPVQGQLAEVADGRRIQMDCRGSGSPTVVFQSGGDMIGSLGWTPVLEKAQSVSRVCAYSRAGMMWSDPASGKFQPEEVARDLRAALQAAGEKPPYVLVAHSRGGLYNMIYAGMFPDDIAGLVFADSSHPDQDAEFRKAGVAVGEPITPIQEAGLALSWTGVMRLVPYQTDPSIEAPVRAYYPKSAAANARESRGRKKTLEVAGHYRDFRNWPVVVLARELPTQTQARLASDARNAYNLSGDAMSPQTAGVAPREAVWRKLQADIATWSSRGRLQVVPDSNHAFFFFRPDVIVDAVTDVVRASRVVTRPAPPAG